MSRSATSGPSDAPDAAPGPVRSGLQKLRADRSARVRSTLGGLAVGLAFAWLHPVGLVVGAALVALPQRTLLRGVAAGLAFGLLAALATVAALAVPHGPSGPAVALAMREVTGVTAALGLAAGLVGGLVRGVG